jgi:uncharacterized protein YutE (UPF0331/DUF86 family)
MVEREIIEAHLQNMEEALRNLNRYKGISLDELKKDLSLIWIVERGLQILIQNLLDIGAHILASEVKTDWDDYSDITVKLRDHDVIPADFSEKIRGVAGLRNILAHEYLKVDVQKLHHYLNHRLPDFVAFMAYVQDYLEQKSTDLS